MSQKSPISPEMKQFLGTLMKKLEKNIKQQYEDELTSVKQTVVTLNNRVKELERELKKQTPLTTASPIKPTNYISLKKMQTTPNMLTSYTPQPTKSNKTLKLDVKNKSERVRNNNPKKVVKPRTRTMERPPELQKVMNELEKDDKGIQDYFGNEELLSRKPKLGNTDSGKTLDSNILKPKPITKLDLSTKKNSLKKSKSQKSKSPRGNKSPRSKSPRSKSPRVKVTKKKSNNKLQSTPSFKGQIKAVVGHRYLLLDDRYGVCKWVKGNKMGMELEIGVGNCDGDLNGVKKFDCKPGMGIFTSTKNIQMDCGQL